MTKQCNECKEVKEVTEFYKDKAFKDGHSSRCKSCKNKKTAEWRSKNKEKYNKDMRSYNKTHYQRLRIMRYKITTDQYNKMFQDQSGLCAICSKPPGGIRPLAIDHDHTTGKVRGLLCYGCNRLLRLLDNQGLLDKAIEYISKSK